MTAYQFSLAQKQPLVLVNRYSQLGNKLAELAALKKTDTDGISKISALMNGFNITTQPDASQTECLIFFGRLQTSLTNIEIYNLTENPPLQPSLIIPEFVKSIKTHPSNLDTLITDNYNDIKFSFSNYFFDQYQHQQSKVSPIYIIEQNRDKIGKQDSIFKYINLNLNKKSGLPYILKEKDTNAQNTADLLSALVSNLVNIDATYKESDTKNLDKIFKNAVDNICNANLSAQNNTKVFLIFLYAFKIATLINNDFPRNLNTMSYTA